MAILVDPPRWPAHGTVWSHLVSDRSLDELHDFARRTGLPPRSFDLDHYDVPAERIPELVAAGAEAVSGRELLRRLVASGLRVRGADRGAASAERRRADLLSRWARLSDDTLDADAWAALGERLIARWAEPHRRYHDLRHLHDVLIHLDVLADAGAHAPRPVHLAAWFHDAVYEGHPGQDEEDSARLAEDELTAAGFDTDEVAEVVRLVRLTATHDPYPSDTSGALLCDADLAILAASPSRYARYVTAVRTEYSHVPEPDFRRGRAQVLRGLLAGRLFTSPVGRERWEAQARANIERELATLES